MAPLRSRTRVGGSMKFRGGQRGTRGSHRQRFAKMPEFKSSRVDEGREDNGSGEEPAEGNDDHPDQPSDTQLSDEDPNQDGPSTDYSYTVLLQSLKKPGQSQEAQRKKRKLTNGNGDGPQSAAIVSSAQSLDKSNPLGTIEQQPLETQSHTTSAEEDDLDEDEPDAEDELDSAKNGMLNQNVYDPFDLHFANPDPKHLTSLLDLEPEKRFQIKTSHPRNNVRITSWNPQPGFDLKSSLLPKSQVFKKRLQGPARNLLDQTDSRVVDDVSPLLNYHDTILCTRSLQNAAQLRNITALHSLNHIFKTRDHVIKNNARIAQHPSDDLPDIRDQGFTRPKVLVVLPTRQACFKFVQSLIFLSEPEQQENKARFVEAFDGSGNEETWDDKPEDFQDLFSGNDDDMFRIGLKFTRKTIKFFSSFYNSDIILASPLGLRNAIENSTNGKEPESKKKTHDADFLSSIEICVIDHATALLMQNWSHVEYICSQLNRLPKEAHGCDFSRVRSWYLDKQAGYYRQTIIMSDYLTPEINALSSTYMLNIYGKERAVRTYKGAMLDLPPAYLPINLTQSFLRFNAASHSADPNSRFDYFTATLLPPLLKDQQQAKGTLVFIPSTFDFIRLRNHFATNTSVAFGTISEYTSVRDVQRARSHFASGKHLVLLYSERAHHFRRYKLKGVRKVLFYGVPENPLFWSEVVGFLGGEQAGGERKDGKGGVKAMFSKWDVLKLERVVGTERVERLVGGKAGDVFEFV